MQPIILNLGCGFKKLEGAINVDGFAECEPDLIWNLNDFPYPWADNSVDEIFAYNVFEHLEDWWRAFQEVTRILKIRGRFEMRVPDSTSDTALLYRDHLHVLGIFSFDGIANRTKGRQLNAWAAAQDVLPIALVRYARIPFAEYNWIPKWILKRLGKHFRNFFWEQRFLFIKILPDEIDRVVGHPKTEILKLMRKRRTVV